MSIERAAQIQFLQTWRVKASKKHLVDNEDIYLLQLLETFDILLAFLLIALVMQNERCCKWFVVPILEHQFCRHIHLLLLVFTNLTCNVEAFQPKTV